MAVTTKAPREVIPVDVDSNGEPIGPPRIARSRKWEHLKEFREFISKLNDDYGTFRYGGIDEMTLHEAAALVHAGAPCIQVAKIAVLGAFACHFKHPSDEKKRIWDILTDFNFRFSGLSLPPEEFIMMLKIQSGNQICDGPFSAISRSGAKRKLPSDLVFEVQRDLMTIRRKATAIATGDTNKESSDDGRLWTEVQEATDHKRKQTLQSCYSDFHAKGFADFAVFLACCSHIGVSGKIPGRTDRDLMEDFNQFWDLQNLIFCTHDLIKVVSDDFSSTMDSDWQRQLRLRSMQRENSAEPSTLNFEIEYNSHKVKELVQSIPSLSYTELTAVQSRLDSVQASTPNISTLSHDAPFSGLAGKSRREHLGAVLIASRMENHERTASEGSVITEYLDAVLVSLSRRSGIIISMEKRLDMVPYHSQLQTMQNEVKPGDVMHLYHIAMFLSTDKLGHSNLMSRADHDVFKAEQIFRNDLFNIMRKTKSKPPLSLSEKVKEIGSVSPYALRELICGLASCGMGIIAKESVSWISMQIGTELGGIVYHYDSYNSDQDPNRGKLLVDLELNGSGIVAKDDVIIARRGIYHFDVQDDIYIQESPAFDKSDDAYRPREEILDGPLA